MILFTSVMISCEIPVLEITPEIVPATIEDYPVITIPETEEKKEMELKPITEYEKYVFTDDKTLYGIIGDKTDAIDIQDIENVSYPLNDFFVKDGDIYFQVKEIVVDNTDPKNPVNEEVTHYFSQVDSKISKFAAAVDYPLVPESNFVEMGVYPYSIVTGDYKGTEISIVKQEISESSNPYKTFLKIDSYFYNLSGLWFTVSDGMVGAEKGLYFWSVGSGRIGSVIIKSGRIW